MALGIFRRKYVVRRFSAQSIQNGYATSSGNDEITELNVQPLNTDELQALPEGERSKKLVKAFGNIHFTAADPDSGIPGDWLWYYGRWYECVAAAPWDHTMLAHCYSEFVAIGENGNDEDLKPPTLEVIP